MLCICDFKSQKNIQLRLSSIIICLLLIDLVVYPSSFGSGFMVRKKKYIPKKKTKTQVQALSRIIGSISEEDRQKRSLGEFVLWAKNNHVESNVYAKGQSWTSGAVDLLLFPLVNQRKNCVITYPHPLLCSTHQRQPRSNHCLGKIILPGSCVTGLGQKQSTQLLSYCILLVRSQLGVINKEINFLKKLTVVSTNPGKQPKFHRLFHMTGAQASSILLLHQVKP